MSRPIKQYSLKIQQTISDTTLLRERKSQVFPEVERL